MSSAYVTETCTKFDQCRLYEKLKICTLDCLCTRDYGDQELETNTKRDNLQVCNLLPYVLSLKL